MKLVMLPLELSVAIWTSGVGVRWYRQDRRIVMDCSLFVVIWLWSVRTDVLEDLVKRWDKLLTTDIISIATIFVVTFALLIYRISSERTATKRYMRLPEGVAKWSGAYPRPHIFPCTTKHARMFPKRHAFEYSYLQCGFPVIPAGVALDGEEIGDGSDVELGSWWMKIRAEDYLQRGHGALGFYGKLKQYLRSQNVKDVEWSYAYLVTAPRFFGYAFNPVSFWYIYDHSNQLTRMILEVNNTFGERRMYLLDGSNSPQIPHSPASTASEESIAYSVDSAKSRFMDIWMKDFHVSPFNSRKGTYTLRALNPFPSPSYVRPMVDNVVTLMSSKDHAKLIARLNSNGEAVDPKTFGIFGTLWFITSWWWVGFVTFPRILREAFKLHFKRSLHVWFRPEVLSSSIGRLPTSSETLLYEVFHNYLTHIVKSSEKTFNIALHTGISDTPTQFITNTQLSEQQGATHSLELRILSPAFYSRLVHYTHISEAFDRECIFTDEKNRTLWISRPELLPLLLSRPASRSAHEEWSTSLGVIDSWRWVLLKKLRCAPAEPVYCVNPKPSNTSINSTRARPFSDLDSFVRASTPRQYLGLYRRELTKLFLAQRLAFGFVQSISLLDFTFRVALCYVGVVEMRNSYTEGSAGMRHWDWWHWWHGVSSVTALASCHLYGLLKGYQ